MLTFVISKSSRDVVILVDALDGIMGGEYVLSSLVSFCAVLTATCATAPSLLKSGTLT